MILTIPEDPEAETQVAALAVATDRGYRSVAAHGVEPHHFYNPLYGRLYAACAALPDLWYDHDWGPDNPAWTACEQPSAADHYGTRPRQAAAAAGCTVEQVLDLADQAVTYTDHDGRWSARVIDAWRRRHALEVIAEAWTVLGRGGNLDTARTVLAQIA